MNKQYSSLWLRRAFFALLVWLLFSSWLPARIYLSVFQAGVFILVCCSLRNAIREDLPLLPHWIIPAMLALPCVGVFQLVAGTSVYPWKTAVATLDMSAWAATGWLSAQFAADPDFRRDFRQLLVILGLMVGIVGVLHWTTSIGLILWTWPNPYQSRTTFPLLNHSHFAAFLEIAVAPAIWESVATRAAGRSHAWCAVIMVCAVWAAGSRSGSVIVTCELAAVIALSVRRTGFSALTRKRALALVITSVLLIAGAGWQGIAARMSSPSGDDLRANFDRASLKMIKAKPWTGFGLGTWATVYPAWTGKDAGVFVEHAHNDLLEWAAEGGIVFACVSISLALFSLGCALREPWCLGVFAAFVQSLVEFPLHKPAVTALVFAAVGCMAVGREWTSRNQGITDVRFAV